MDELTQRERELTQLNERLQDLGRAKEAFLSVISREFRTPLTLMLGPLQDLLDSPASSVAEESRAVLQAAQRNALRLLGLVDNLPEVSPTEGERDSTSCEPIDLASFTAELAGNFRSACDWAGLNLVVDCPPLPDRVPVDRSAWEKIVLNLLANAFKSTAKGTIEVRLLVQNGNARLSIHDTGSGIAEKELPYIFGHARSLAQAGDDASERPAFGLGLVRDLVQFYNGSIDAHSELGTGSTITVSIPLTDKQSSTSPDAAVGGEERTASSATPSYATSSYATSAAPAVGLTESGSPTDVRSRVAAPVSSPGGRVVIADDNADMLAQLGKMLNTAGYEVEAVPDGSAALAACQARPPDAVISDLTMPGMNGFELIERLRADEQTAVIPVLLLSGHAGEDSRIAGLRAGADDYLVKPLGRRELVARVDGAVRLARMRREMARRAQADLESLFATAFDAILVVAPDGRILKENAQAQKLFGYSVDEFSRLKIEALMPENRRRAHVGHRASYLQAPVSRLMRPKGELRGLRRDGREFIAEVGLGPIQFRNQDCTIADVRDITERVKAQEALKKAMTRLQELSERLTKAQEEERHKIAFELHEQLGQEVSTLKMHLNMFVSFCKGKDAEALHKSAITIVDQMLQRVRSMALDLRPSQLDDFGVYVALRMHCKQQAEAAGWEMHFDASEAGERPKPEVELACFRVVQEALTNAARYAKATEMWVSLHRSNDELHLSIRDNGIGFDTSEFQEGRPATSLGLIGMAERIRQVGGRLKIKSSLRSGTRIDASIPLG